MPTTYKLLADTTLGSAGTITFSSISQSYQDLVVRIYLAGNTATNDFGPDNSDNTASFYGCTFRYNQTSLNSRGLYTNPACYIEGGQPGSSETGAFGWQEIYIPNYANTSYNKIWHTNGGFIDITTASVYGVTWAEYGQQTSTALSSIVIQGNGAANLRTGSRATLYGIAK